MLLLHAFIPREATNISQRSSKIRFKNTISRSLDLQVKEYLRLAEVSSRLQALLKLLHVIQLFQAEEELQRRILVFSQPLNFLDRVEEALKRTSNLNAHYIMALSSLRTAGQSSQGLRSLRSGNDKDDVHASPSKTCCWWIGIYQSPEKVPYLGSLPIYPVQTKNVRCGG